MNISPVEMTRINAQQAYTDLNQLNDIRQLGQDDQDLALKQIAKQFESMFMHMMLKSMRSANEVFAKDNPLNSFASGFYRDMYDNQLSLSLSQGNGMGLSDALYRQLSQSYLSSDKTIGGQTDYPIDKSRINSLNPYDQSLQQVKQKHTDSHLLNSINSPEDFIKLVSPYAKPVAEKLGVDYQVLVAQSALETGWGEHIIRDRHGRHSFNLFNIKADARWDGHHVKVPTLEYRDGLAHKETANFRRYESIEDSFNDYIEFLSQPRYQKAVAAEDSNTFVNELQRAGYATDPKYADKILSILNRM